MITARGVVGALTELENEANIRTAAVDSIVVHRSFYATAPGPFQLLNTVQEKIAIGAAVRMRSGTGRILVTTFADVFCEGLGVLIGAEVVVGNTFTVRGDGDPTSLAIAIDRNLGTSQDLIPVRSNWMGQQVFEVPVNTNLVVGTWASRQRLTAVGGSIFIREISIVVRDIT